MYRKLNIFNSFLLLSFMMWALNLRAEQQHDIEIDFYGHPFSLHYRYEKPAGEDLNNIVSFYQKSEQTESLINQIDNFLRPYHGDDFAWFILLKKITNIVYKSESREGRTIFMYSVLLSHHKDVILGYSNNGATLYGRTNVSIDNCLFIRKGTHIYYDLSFSQTSVPAAEQEFVAQKDNKKYVPLVMNVISPPKFNARSTERILPFEYDGFVYFFKTRLNQSLVDYYRDLPAITINTVYLNYGLSTGAQQSLIDDMRKAVAILSKAQALDFILKFTQTAIEYRKDIVEKFAFPEETLAANYADCEDKATLFAVLVKEILGMQTVGLYYKNAEHINVAVASWDKKNVGSFSFNNKEYIICEPSGKGYNVGENSIDSQMASLIDW